jgi:vacuolar protein sorting-associated protein 54
MAPVGKGLGTMTAVTISAAQSVTSVAEAGLGNMAHIIPSDFPALFAKKTHTDAMNAFYDPSMDDHDNDDDDDDVYSSSHEDARAYLSASGHHLHSVLSNPRMAGGNLHWMNGSVDALMDVFTLPGETEATISAILNVPMLSKHDFDMYKKQFRDASALYMKNHERPVREQLASANVPTVAAADGNP